MDVWRGVIEEYRDRMPVDAATPVFTLGEGGTPLVSAPRLSERTACDVYLKVEGANPTGSFKDRGMTVAISRGVQDGVRAVICASTGNTSASAAAYATRAGLSCAVLVPRGRIAVGKLTQAVAYGARLLEVDGSFDDCLRVTRAVAEKYPVLLANSANPDGHRLAGQKSAAFEVVDVLGDAPEVHCLPVGNAGNIAAYWLGYVEYAKDGVSKATPRMLGFQAAGAAPIVSGHVVAEPHTRATAIQVGNPASWQRALAARDESGGAIEAVTDEQILAAHALVAREEGVFCEPGSAASIAGLLASAESGLVRRGSRVVCTLTGHGLKDPEALTVDRTPDASVAPDVGAVAAALDLA
jgi:threonine synthase